MRILNLATTLVAANLWLVFSWGAPVARAAPQESASEDETGQEAASPEPVLTRQEVLYVDAVADTVATSSSIATKLPLSIRQTPAAVSVVTGSMVEEQGGVILGDALRNVSGANVHTQTGVHDFFLLRGFDSLSTGLVLTDGAAEPEATFYQLYNVDRVEVLKGPGGFLYGGNPLSGTVNLVRKAAQRESFLSVGLSYGSYATEQARFDLNLGSAERTVSFRLNALWFETDGYRDRTPGESLGLNPTLTWWMGDSGTLRLNVEYLKNDFAPDAGLPVSGATTYAVPRTRSYQSPFDFSEQDIERLRIDYETQLGSSWTLRNKAYYTELDWRSDGTLFFGTFPSTPPGSATLLRGLTLLDNQQRFLGDQLEALLQLEDHTLLVGLEVLRNRDEFTIDVGILPFMDVLSPVETATRPVPIFPDFSEAGDSTSRVVAPYILDRFSLTPRLHLFLGARLDLVDFTNVAGVSRKDEQVSPMLGLTFAAGDTVSLYANLGGGFAPPSTRVVEDQDPEESEQAEVGLKGEFHGGKTRFNLALYELRRENIAIADDTGFTAQQGTQRSRGIELDLSGTPLTGLHYHLAYAYTDAELLEFNEAVGLLPPFVVIDRSGNTPALAPKHTLSFWLGKRFKNRFAVGGGGRYVSEQFIAEDNVFRIDSALTFDATLSWTQSRWRWSLNGRNLTDEEYDTRGFGAFSVIPASRAGVALGVDFRL